jgi:hypothetical protein
MSVNGTVMPGPEFFGHDDAPNSAPQASPTSADPLRGLSALRRVAVVGRTRLHALASAPVVYAWQDIAVAGTIVLLASGPSEGKTTLLALILAAHAHDGEPLSLLGREVTPMPLGTYAVVIEGEHSEASFARKMIRACQTIGASDDALDRLIIVARKAVRLGSPEWADVVRLIGAGLVGVVAIDTIARVAPAAADDEREQVAIFDGVAQAIEAAPSLATRPTVYACAHTRKNGRTGELADVSGSTQRTGQADTVLMLAGQKRDGRTVATTVTFAKLREEPDEYPAPVTFALEGTALRYLHASSQDDDRPLEARILDALAPGPMTKRALRDQLQARAGLEEAISTLFGERRIETTQVTAGGRSWKAFRLRAEHGMEHGMRGSEN